MAVLPPAPGMFSATICWPQFSDSFCATMRAITSLGPPAANARKEIQDVETQADPPGSARCRGEIQELGQMGTRRRNRYAQLHVSRRHRGGGQPGTQRQGYFAGAQLRPYRPARRQEQLS